MSTKLPPPGWFWEQGAAALATNTTHDDIGAEIGKTSGAPLPTYPSNLAWRKNSLMSASCVGHVMLNVLATLGVTICLFIYHGQDSRKV